LFFTYQKKTETFPSLISLTHTEFIFFSRIKQKKKLMLVRKSQYKKKTTTGTATGIPLDSSLTSIEWLPKMQIGENPLPSTTTPDKQSLPTSSSSSLPITLLTTNIPQKIETNEIELPTSTVHLKPPYSYVTLIRQAISSSNMQRMTLNEIYQWIVDSYPYFRTAPPKWKV
jgi:hypothetical protein